VLGAPSFRSWLNKGRFSAVNISLQELYTHMNPPTWLKKLHAAIMIS